MGIVNFSIPKELVLKLIEKVQVKNFVETGTFEGGTSFWAANFFKKVYTIEISEEISARTAAKSNCPDNIEFIVGDSRAEMPKLVKRIDGLSFFWLDGHWCSNAGGKEDECPLMDELKAIANLEDPIIFIDDARCFLGPLPPPHNYKDWPTIDEIFAFCRSTFKNSFTTIIDDVIICVPENMKSIIFDYWMDTFQARYAPQHYSEANNMGVLEKVLRKGRNVLKSKLKKQEDITPDWHERFKNEYVERNKWLQDKGLNAILDIGANTGQFVERIRWVLPDIQVYSFEPIPLIFNKLLENFKDDTKFKGYNLGLGDENGVSKFYLNEFPDSSSFLKMNNVHKENFPTTINESEIQVQIKRLDDVLDAKSLPSPYLVKLDVQGFEEKVIKGGQMVIENADYIITEVSFVELYDGQPLFDKLYTMLKDMGFCYMGNFDQLASYTTNEILQADAIFKKIRN